MKYCFQPFCWFLARKDVRISKSEQQSLSSVELYTSKFNYRNPISYQLHTKKMIKAEKYTKKSTVSHKQKTTR